MITPPAIALVAGRQRIQFPRGGPWRQVKIANESPYDLSLQIAGITDELGAWTANVWDVNGTNFIDVTATALQPIAGSATSVIELTLAGPGETIDGTYPVALVRQANVQSPQTQLGDLVFPVGTSTQTTDPVPAGTHALLLISASGAIFTGASVIGQTSGAFYMPVDNSMVGVALVGRTILCIPISSVLDTRFQVTMTNTSASSATVRVVAVLDSEAVWVQNTSQTPVFTRGITKPYDGTATSNPGAGTAASVTLAANTQGDWEAHTALGAVFAGAQTADRPVLQLLDGASPLMDHLLGIVATIGSWAPFTGIGLAYRGTNNTSMTLKFLSSATGEVQSVALGAHLVGF